MLAHLLAFRMSARLVARGKRTAESAQLLVAQIAGGGVVTALATIPLLVLCPRPGLLVAELALLALITGVGYITGRASGYSRLRSLLYVLGVIALTVVVLEVKALAHH